MATKQFNTNIPELIRKLGRNLYNDPFIATRELLQNANDACILAEGLFGATKGRIHVLIDKENGILSVQDNGIGMNQVDLEKFLSTIASSKKKEYRKKLDDENFDHARGIAGQFGIGFLSTFIISKKVEVFSRHFSEQGNGSVWSSTGDGAYSIGKSPDLLSKGTKVVLHIKKEFMNVLNPVRIGEIFQKHCPYIRTPYYINNSTLPLNHELPPWQANDDLVVADSYIRNQFQEEPLIHFYISFEGPVKIKKNKYLKYRQLEQRKDYVEKIRIDAYFTIPSRSKYFTEKPKLYTSGLFIGSIDDGLPEWASFIIGGIECPDLDLTLGRDNIMDDITWLAARQIIEEKLEEKIVAALSDKNSALRDQWKQVFESHSEKILRAAVNTMQDGNSSFFNAVKDLVPFKVGNDKLSLKQIVENGKYLKRNDEKVVFFHASGHRLHESSGVQEKLLFDHADMHFIEAPNYYERDFLLQYSESSDEIKLVPVEDGVKHMLEYKDDTEEGKLVVDIFRAIGIKARFTHFKPDSLAAVVLPREFGNVREIEIETEEGKEEFFEILSGNMKGHIEKPYLLCINGENNLIVELIKYVRAHGIDNYIKSSFRQIYYQSVLVFGDTNKRVIAEMTPSISNVTMGFLKRTSEHESELVRLRKRLQETELQQEEIERTMKLQEPLKKKENSVFLAYGYDEESLKLVEPFKKMLSKNGFNVINGEVDKMGSLSQQIVSKIGQCECFVGILTSRDTLQEQQKNVPSTWVIEEKGVARAFGIPVLMIVEDSIASSFFGNIEGDSMRISVKDNSAGSWVDAYIDATEVIKNTLNELRDNEG